MVAISVMHGTAIDHLDPHGLIMSIIAVTGTVTRMG